MNHVSASTPAEVGRGVVLAVDDDEDVRAIVADILRSEGYRVLEAADGADALSVLERAGGAVDLVLTDVRMPRMDGGQLARMLQHRHPGVPILFMTGYAGESLVREGFLERGAPLLLKPFSVEELTSRVQQLLETHAVRH